MKRMGILLAAIVAAFVTLASPAMAQEAPYQRCSAALPVSGPNSGLSSEPTSGPNSSDTESWLAQGPQWNCPADFSNFSNAGHAVRFTWDGSVEMPPKVLISRVAKFESLTIFARDGAENWSGTTHAFSDIEATYLDRQFAVPLPELPAGSGALVVVVNAPTQAIPLDYMRLADSPPGTSAYEFGALLLIALVCGLILMPLLFDFIFWRVLREPFILWHAAFVGTVACQLVFTAGLYLPAFSLSLDSLRLFTVGSFGALVVTGMMFISAFLEKDALSKAMRCWLLIGAAMMAAVTALHAPGFASLGSAPATIFYMVGAPIALINLVVAIHAWRRGSRYIRYIVFGFGPLFLVAVIRVVSFLIPGIPTDDMNGLFLAGVVIEASATALGVATRFVQIKRERDVARSEAETLEDLAGHDPLTGLLNRRSIEPRFLELHRSGYETIAILDLDHFKRVNDTHGHAKGDEVLKAVAEALRADANAMATRIGGEEFLLLVKGDDGLDRAERIRRSVSLRVAREVSGLEGPVTASMGVLCVPPGAMPKADFADFYAMADKLLYEAKAQGRNRHVAERLRAFRARKNDRRKSAAA